MNARTDLHAESDAPASPSPSWPSRWRRRLQTWRRPLAVMLPAAGATQAFEAWAAQHPGAAVEVGLSSHCLLMLADDSASEAPRGQALRERAVERWTHYLDLPAQEGLHGAQALVALGHFLGALGGLGGVGEGGEGQRDAGGQQRRGQHHFDQAEAARAPGHGSPPSEIGGYRARRLVNRSERAYSPSPQPMSS